MASYQTDLEPTKVAGAVEAQTQETRDFLAGARRRFKLAVDAENKFRMASLDDLKFRVGEQWPGDTKNQRSEENRPCLTINRMPAICKQVVNEQRAQRPSIVVKPVGDGADTDTAEIWEGILRHIQVNSDSEVAVDCAFDQMVTGGKGYLELVLDYLPGKTFDQELYIRRIKNHFTVYCDPMSQWADESDANWKFKICDYDYAEYKAQFPDTTLATLSDFSSIGDNFPGWGDSKTIRVAEYWHKEWDEEKLYHLEDGTVMGSKDYNKMVQDMPIKPKIVKQRKYRQCTVQCDVINALEIVDSYTFPGTVGYIPLIPCLGDDFDVNGERELSGIIRNGKDAQRSINYFRSYAAEVIALAPKAPWVGWKGQFKDGKWQNANVVNYAYLEADVVTTTGQPAPSLPQRNQFEPPIQAILAMSQAVDQDLKSVTGIYEPSLGQTKTDQSGKAIDLLQKQGGLTNLNFTDNLSRTLRHIGRVCLDVVPYVYDAPRVQRIIKPDGDTSHVIVHSGRAQAADGMKDEDVSKVYDLSVGTYDVVIDIGPTYKTKREEAFSMQMQLAQADKTGEIMKVAGDIIVGNSDMPGAKEIAARIKKIIPPQVLDDDGTDPKVAAQKMAAQLQQAQQVNQELMKHNAEMMDEIKTEKVKAQTDIHIATIRASAQVEAAGLSAKIDLARLEFDKWQLAHQTAHEAGLAASQQEADATAQATQQAHEADQAQQQQGHEEGMQQSDQEAAAAQPEAANG